MNLFPPTSARELKIKNYLFQTFLFWWWCFQNVPLPATWYLCIDVTPGIIINVDDVMKPVIDEIVKKTQGSFNTFQVNCELTERLPLAFCE